MEVFGIIAVVVFALMYLCAIALIIYFNIIEPIYRLVKRLTQSRLLRNEAAE